MCAKSSTETVVISVEESDPGSKPARFSTTKHLWISGFSSRIEKDLNPRRETGIPRRGNRISTRFATRFLGCLTDQDLALGGAVEGAERKITVAVDNAEPGVGDQGLEL